MECQVKKLKNNNLIYPRPDEWRVLSNQNTLAFLCDLLLCAIKIYLTYILHYTYGTLVFFTFFRVHWKPPRLPWLTESYLQILSSKSYPSCFGFRALSMCPSICKIGKGQSPHQAIIPGSAPVYLEVLGVPTRLCISQLLLLHSPKYNID